MAQKAVAVGILGIAKTGSDYTVTAFAQPEAAYIPEGGVGKVYTVDIPPTGNGTADPTQAIAVSVFLMIHLPLLPLDSYQYS